MERVTPEQQSGKTAGVDDLLVPVPFLKLMGDLVAKKSNPAPLLDGVDELLRDSNFAKMR